MVKLCSQLSIPAPINPVTAGAGAAAPLALLFALAGGSACKPAADPPAAQADAVHAGAEEAPTGSANPAIADPAIDGSPLTDELLAIHCAGPEGVEDCAPGAFAETFRASLPWIAAHQGEVEARWLRGLEVVHQAAYGLAYLHSARALPILRVRLLADRTYYGWETDHPEDLEVRLGDDQYPHHQAYIMAIEAISGQALADAVALTDEERGRLIDESLRPADDEHAADVARWLLLQLLRPSAPVEASPAAITPTVFADGCWDARASTQAAAKVACEALRRRGDAWQRRNCRCAAEDMIEVRADDPIAYYHYGWDDEPCSGVGSTPLAAWRACTIEQLQGRARGINDACACPERGPSPVLGPYPRARAVGEYDDPEAYAYLDPARGWWLDRRGDAPCFVAGTMIETPEGPRPIEALRPGDALIARDPESRAEVVTAVLRVKSTTATRLVRLTLAGGGAITTTPNHPFYAPRAASWVDAGALRAGDAILERGPEGAAAPRVIEAVTSWADDVAVHGITVGPPHTYFAGGALVHNY